MNRSVFLDVGAHRGQTLQAVVKLGFDHIYSFEPVASCWGALKKFVNDNVSVEKFGLWDKDVETTVYEPGTMSAGLWIKDKRRLVDYPVTTTLCQFRSASGWFKENILPDDIVYMKLNCEGCECDILIDLICSGEFEKVAYAMVDFDARKIVELQGIYTKTLTLLEKFAAPRVLTSKEAMVGKTHKARIHHWLQTIGYNKHG